MGTTIEYANALGCTQVNCLAGITPEGEQPEKVRETFIENLRFAADKLERAGIRLLIEPINTRDVPGFFLNQTEQALAVIEAVASDNVSLQYDIYRMQVMEGDLAMTVQKNLDTIAHMQLADNPGCHEPGTGETNYTFLFDFIDKLGYSDRIGLEYKPLTTTEAGLGWMTLEADRHRTGATSSPARHEVHLDAREATGTVAPTV